VLAASIIRAMGDIVMTQIEAAGTSETSVKFHQTTGHNKPEDGHLHIRRSQNLKSHKPNDI
jgi:hypothetical protein